MKNRSDREEDNTKTSVVNAKTLQSSPFTN